ncbi:YD repeat-containing protein [Chitinophaga polysaccharea]|uniref:YD repeat-containing protein n=2 Tax=Chitinophaga polysaccharea TaxID=1293035 RepID=A0A561PQF4_9BACT|nr:YD repeat-containing protein [Chitinophaga polysaccharea]
MYLVKKITRVAIFVLLMCQSIAGWSQTAVGLKKLLDGSKHQLAKDSLVTVTDTTFFSAFMQPKLVLPYPAKNIISFRLNEYSPLFLPSPFSATANIRIIYTKADQQKDSVQTSITINYDTLKQYTVRNSYVFNDAHQVTVKVLDVTTTAGSVDVLPALLIENEMIVQPTFKWSYTDDAVKTISSNSPPNTDATDEIMISWPAITGADEYDLEWAYIDSSALAGNRYGNPVKPSLVFDNNATRVMIPGNSYAVPLLYDDRGALFFRVRAVQVKKGDKRIPTAWSSDYASGLGRYDFGGHQRKLNWHADISFAEGGKRKAVVQYYDGSLRSRQSVTKDNTSGKTIVGETYYDGQGRPVIQVLPAPTLNTVIQYSRNFNTAINGAEYDKSQYDLQTNQCDAGAPAFSSTSGAGLYYSPNNPEKTDGYQRYIPDAQGYAFTETAYTPDNTGRINRQGGVGAGYQLGSNHETKYYYGTPSQEELDALFGTEAGDKSHYFKNMVRDANGQYSVSYVDMNGRTIATALSGMPENASLDKLSSNVEVSVIDTLSSPGSNVVKELAMESKQSQLIAAEGDYQFSYLLTPPVLQKKDCNNNTVCYTGLYDLEIKITDDCNNQKLGGVPYVSKLQNYTLGNIIADCTAPSPMTLQFSLHLPPGNYEITKRLLVSKDGMDYYRDNIFLPANTCKTLQQFIDEQQVIFASQNPSCVPDCKSCLDSIGSWTTFRDRYISKTGIAAGEVNNGQILSAYQAAMDACNALCNKLTDADDIQRAMLLDVSAPSGQYAAPADSASKYSIFYQPDINATPPYRSSAIIYLDESRQADKVYNEQTGTYVVPQLLPPALFAAKFKPSWAEALLPFHPEYCKLKEYQKHASSLAWDRLVTGVDTYAEAKQKGYLNPTASTIAPANLPAVAAGQDPLSQESAALKSQLEAKLSKYAGNYSMWAVATLLSKCTQSDMTACAAIYGATPFDETKLCGSELDMAWRNFRELYQNTKRDIINNLVKQAACAGAGELIAAGKQPNFNNATDALNQNGFGYLNDPNLTAAGAITSGNQAMSQYYSDNCNAYVKLWMQQLAPCKYSQAALEEIMPKLIQVCKEGSDQSHPNGASTVKPSSTNTYRSFQQVLDEYNRQHGITDPLSCNAEMITAPAPYDKQPAYGSRPSYTGPDDCECRQLTALQQQYVVGKQPEDVTFSKYLARTRGITITEDALQQLLTACAQPRPSTCNYSAAPMQIPAFMQCDKAPACVGCKDIADMYQLFKTTYPSVIPTIKEGDTIQQKKNGLFASFMNNRLGFNKQAWEYLRFIDSCGSSSSWDSTACRSLISYSNNNGTDVINNLERTSDGGYILVGSSTGRATPGRTDRDAYVIKTDNKGNVLWAKTYGGAKDDWFARIRPTQDGGYVAIGGTQSGAHTMDVFVLKMDGAGNVSWSKAIGYGTSYGEECRDIIQTSDGGYAFSGNHNLGPGVADMLIGSLDAQGTPRWIRRLGTPSTDQAYTLVENHDTLVVTAIAFVGGSSVYDGLVVKLDKNTGTLSKVNRYNVGARKNTLNGIFKTATGYRIAILNGDDIDDSNANVVFLDINDAGGVIAAKKLDRPAGKSIKWWFPTDTTPDKGMIIGETLRNIPQQTLYLNKIKADNTFEWSSGINIPGNMELQCIRSNADGSYAGAGIYNNQAMLLLTTARGKAGCSTDSLTAGYTDVAYTQSVGSLFYDSYLQGGVVDFPVTGVLCSPSINSSPCSSGTGVDCITYYKGPLLCGNAAPVFEPVDVNTINNCSDNNFFAVSKGTELFKAYRDSILGSFDKDYITTCLLAGSQEQFTVTHNLSEYHYTLYYYNQAGNLVRTVPPAGVIIDRSATWLNRVKAARKANQLLSPAHTLISSYRYNTLNQVVVQQTPDGGSTQFWYDRLGRLAVSQNARQQPQSRYSYTLYDALGRITEVGETISGAVMTDVISRNANALTQWISNARYSKSQVTTTVYDQPYAPLAPVMTAANLRNRVSWTALYNTATDMSYGNYASASFYSYDFHGNVDTLIQDYKQGSMATMNNRFKKLQYNYDLISGKVNMFSYQPGQADALYQRYEYDAENRLTNVYTSQDSLYWENDAYYQYYRHGPLARSVLGQQQVQGVDYVYTLQGWLKAVNPMAGGDGAAGSPVAADAYNYVLQYNGGDYSGINAASAGATFPAQLGTDHRPLYNGNISSMAVNIGKLNTALLYNYRYDQLNRLVKSDAWKGTTGNWSGLQKIADLGEAISYDPMGNIVSNQRKGNNSLSGKPLEMDDLSYHYLPGTNRLDYISDVVPATNYTNDIDDQTAGNYGYDAIGNLTTDRQAGISNISWSVYGKIQSITKTDGSTISYTYDAAGNRISKTFTGGGKTQSTWYVRDAQGNVISVYTGGDPDVNGGNLTQTESHLYGSSRLGMSTLRRNVQNILAPNAVNLPGLGPAINFTFVRGNKLFELNNHLGNVLATVSDKKLPVPTADNKSIASYTVDVLNAQDYYAFGMLQPGRTFAANGGVYRYGFNGMEKSDEIKGEGNSYTAEFWEYDPRIGRRWNNDPVYKHSPYEAFGSNPIINADPSGLDTINFNRSVTTFNPGGGRRSTGTSSFNIGITKSSGADVFMYNFTSTVINSKGGSTTTSTSTQLHPEDRGSASGMTWGKDLYFDGVFSSSRKNYDWESIGKMMSADKSFASYMVGRNANAADWMQKSGSFTLMEGLMPTMVQSGLGAYSGAAFSTSGKFLAGYGNDQIVLESMANLPSRKGWFDVVVHGAKNGEEFIFNGQRMSVEALYSKMLADGYQQGTRIRLMSCWSGSLEGGAAQRLSTMSQAMVVAPTRPMFVGYPGSWFQLGKPIVPGGIFKVFKP